MEILAKLSSGDNRVTHLDLRKEDVNTELLHALAEKLEQSNFVCRVSWRERSCYDENLKKKIEAKIKLNYQNFKPHPNDYVHSLLSKHVYADSKEGDCVQFPVENGAIDVEIWNKELKSWKALKVFNYPEAGRYYSIAYLNADTKHMVLAHRGTLFKKADLLKFQSPLVTDLDGILGKKIVAQQKMAFVATEEVIDEAKRKGYNVSFTGHSLGAWLAELSVYHSVDKLKYFQSKAVTFDSPGSASAVECLVSNVKSYETNCNLENLDITTYLSAPNFVNCCNKHIGKVYRIFPNINWADKTDEYKKILQEIPLRKQIQPIIMGLLSILGHSMAPIISTFDPVTGKPRNLEKVLDWPLIKYQPTSTNTTVATFLGSVPVLNWFPGLTMWAYEIIPKPAFLKCLNIFDQFINGNFTSQQFWEVYEHLQFNAKDGYSLNDALSPGEKFDLFYKGHYCTQKLDQCRDVYNPKSKDWYLHQLWELQPQDIDRREINNDVKQVLKSIQGKYRIELDGIRKFIRVVTSDIQIDTLREEIVKLCGVYSEIKEILENKNAYLPNEPRNQSLLIISNLPHCSENIIDRPKVLEEVGRVLNQHRRIVISAFGGTGKSTIAKEYGRSIKDDLSAETVRYIVADSSEKINEEYKCIVKNDYNMNMTGLNAKSIMQIVHSSIKNSKSTVLFIFDNVENSEDVRDYIEGLYAIESCKVIITTRNKNLSRDLKLQSYKLDPFTRREAQSYIEKNSAENRFTPQEIEILLDKLGGEYSLNKNQKSENFSTENYGCYSSVLPYSLSHAIAYFNRNPLFKVEQYLEYAKNSSDATGTFLLLDLINTSELSFQVLQYSAYLDPDFISIDIFTKLLNVGGDTLNDVVKKLEGSSLVTVRWLKQGQCGLQLHRLVQHWVKEYAAAKIYLETVIDEQVIFEKIVQVLSFLFPVVTKVPKNDWQVSQKLVIHAEKILQNKEHIIQCRKQIELSELFGRLGNYKYIVACDYTQALKYYQEALKLDQKLYKDLDFIPNIANSPKKTLRLQIYGLPLTIRGCLDITWEWCKRALTLRFLFPKFLSDWSQGLPNKNTRLDYVKDACDPLEHEEELNSGLTLEARKILQAEERHYHIAIIFHNLGNTWRRLGDNVKALKYFEDALEIRRTLYPGQNHRDIANTLTKIAYAYSCLSDYPKALQIFEDAFKMRQALYTGQNHPDIAESKNCIGLAHYNLGENIKALEYRKEALEMNRALYPGQNHPDIAADLNDLGITYESLGEYAKALEYANDASEMYRALYPGKNNPYVARSLNILGVTYEALGEYAKALEYGKEAIQMYRVLYAGRYHPDVAKCLNNLGRANQNLGELAKALEFEKEALEMKKIIYAGQSHTDVAISLNNLGVTYESLGKYAKALEYEKDALEMFRALHWGKNHPYVATSLNILGITYAALGEYEKALEYGKEALKMYRALYPGKNHPDVAISLKNLGVTYHNLGKLANALKYNKEALEMYQGIYPGQNHPHLVTSLYNLGVTYEALDDYAKSLEYKKDSLEMNRALCSGQNHPNVTSSIPNPPTLVIREICYRSGSASNIWN